MLGKGKFILLATDPIVESVTSSDDEATLSPYPFDVAPSKVVVLGL